MTDILTPSECAKLADIEARMTPEEWRIASDLPAFAIMSADGYHVVQTENQNNYHHFGHSEIWHGLERRDDAIGIVELRNAAPRMLATITELRNEFALADGGRKSFARQTVELYKTLATIAEAFGFDGDADDDSFIDFMKGRVAIIAAHEATIARLRKDRT